MILVSYDGSADAQAAIDRAAEFAPGAATTVLTIWEPCLDMLSRTGSLGLGMGMGAPYGDMGEIDAATHAAAATTATAGAERARTAGLAATPQTAERDGDIAHTVLAVADELDAGLIVLGTRGLGGVEAFLMGSVSHAVVQHADRAVLVVPSAELAERRHAHVHHAVGRVGDAGALLRR